MLITPPAKADYGFYNSYVFRVTDTDLITALHENMAAIKGLAASIAEEDIDFRYEEGKWSLRELFFHLVDSERNFCYRIMRISRGDQGQIPGFNIHEFVINAHVGNRTITSILQELELLRKATIILFEEMPEEILERTGPARDVIISVRALGFGMVGHVLHHFDIIRGRYLPALDKQAAG